MFITPSLLLIGLAVLMAAIFIPAILSTKKFQKSVKHVVSNSELARTVSLPMFLMSFLFLSVHWRLTGGWFIIIPIIGWLTLIKALIYLWFPEFVYDLAKKIYLKSEAVTAVIGFVGLLLTIGLVYVALYIY